MDWLDVNDVLYDGKKDEIAKLRCPDCGGNIEYEYERDIAVFKVMCPECGYVSKENGAPEPNCAKIFGIKHTIR